MFALFVKFILEFETLIVGFYCADSFDGGGDPIVHVPLTKFFSGDGAITGIMIREAGVPPDGGVNVFGQFHAMLIAAGFAGGAVEVDVFIPVVLPDHLRVARNVRGRPFEDLAR